ncbi:MAG: DUF374 domain-containing protein [Acidobacteriota bacterium]
MARRLWYLGGMTVGIVLRAWRATMRLEVRNRQVLAAGPCVLAVWHGRLLGVLMDQFDSGLVTMASRSADGALAAGAVRLLGLAPARGSSSVGGREALADMQNALMAGAPLAGLTVDGPRGPWQQVKAGVAALAVKLEIPIVPATFSCTRGRLLSSWDRMLVPKPFTRLVVHYGEPWPPERLRAAADPLLEVGQDLRELTRALDIEVAGRDLWPAR